MGIAHASEEFRSWIIWNTLSPDPGRYWSGDAPRLTSADGDTSAAYVEGGPSVTIAAVTVTLVPFTLTATTKMSMQVRTLGLTADTFELFFADGDGNNYVWTNLEVTSDWVVVEGTVGGFDNWDTNGPYLVAAAAAGELVAGVIGPLGTAEGYAVSWIDVGEGAIPLRVRQRGDGLGMGGPRVRNVGSRQGSPRVRGYL